MFRELFEMAGLNLISKEKQGDFPKVKRKYSWNPMLKNCYVSIGSL